MKIKYVDVALFSAQFHTFLHECVFHLCPAVNLVKVLSLLKQTNLQNRTKAEIIKDTMTDIRQTDVFFPQ